MNIAIEHFDGKYPSFNVNLASKEGAEPFLVIKGCRIVNGKSGDFVSFPATKNEKTGKYWNHVYANDRFSNEVLRLALAQKPKAKPVEDDLDVPF